MDQINRYLETIDGVHFSALEKLLAENSKQMRQILILMKMGVIIVTY